MAYNLSGIYPDLVTDAEEVCSSQSYNIAPIPPSAVALQSSLNATYTGVIPGATGGSDAQATSPSTTSGDVGPTSSDAVTGAIMSSQRPSATVWTSIYTLDGGADGAGAPRSTDSNGQQQSTGSTPSATPTGAAQRVWDGSAAGLSVLVCVLMGLAMT